MLPVLGVFMRAHTWSPAAGTKVGLVLHEYTLAMLVVAHVMGAETVCAVSAPPAPIDAHPVALPLANTPVGACPVVHKVGVPAKAEAVPAFVAFVTAVVPIAEAIWGPVACAGAPEVDHQASPLNGTIPPTAVPVPV